MACFKPPELVPVLKASQAVKTQTSYLIILAVQKHLGWKSAHIQFSFVLLCSKYLWQVTWAKDCARGNTVDQDLL